MKLHLMSHGAWTVLAVYADEERCGVLEFADDLRRDDPREFARLMRAFDRLAASGPPRNERRSRALPHGIFELKTPGGVRGLAQAVERGARTRWRHLSDKRRGALQIVEDQ